MKTFFAKLILLIALVMAIVVYEWWGLERHIQNLGQVHGARDMIAKIVKTLQRAPTAKVIFAGDSKAERHLDPRVFVADGIPAINTAIPSGDLWTLVHSLEGLGLDSLKATFVISVGSYQINDGHSEKDAYSAEVFFSLTPWERLKMFKSSYFLAARKMLFWNDAYLEYPLFVKQVLQMSEYFGNEGFNPIEPNEYSCMRFRHNSHVSPVSMYRNADLNGGRWRLFREALKKMESWKGTYVLYNSPYSKKGKACLQGSYAEDIERDFSEKVKAATKDLKHVRFIDFFFDPPITIDENLYYDPGHLDKRGAEIFTKWWLAYLKSEKLL